jgi:hypothetical protein
MTSVLFGDVEAAVIDHLNANLTEDVADRVPTDTKSALAAGFVVVSRVGGPRVGVVTEQPTVTIEAWAASWSAAENLIQRARQQVHAMSGGVHNGLTVYGIREFAGPARLPDPVSGSPRKTLTVSLTVRGLS